MVTISSAPRKIQTRLARIVDYSKKHKMRSFLLLAVLFGIAWVIYGQSGSANAETRYVLGTASRGAVIASVSGSGQIAASDQIDIKPKVSGEVVWVGVKAGDQVWAGKALAQLDRDDALQAVADAEHELAEAKLQYEKDAAQAPIDFEKAKDTLADSLAGLENTYNEIYNIISDAYLDLPTVMTGSQNILYGSDLSPTRSQWNIGFFRNIVTDSEETTIKNLADSAESDYKAARVKYDAALIEYKKMSRYSDKTDLEQFLKVTSETVTAIAEAIQSELNLLDGVKDHAELHSITLPTAVSTMRTNAQAYLQTVNGNSSALYDEQKALAAAKKAIRDAENNLKVLQIGNATGADPISLQSSRFGIADKERKLADLKAGLADYVIIAPFTGTVSSVNIKLSDIISASVSAATLITKEKQAKLSLNEVDAAKIKVGNKATLTFDAIEELTLTGKVSEIDAVGTVSQGVVAYGITILLDTDDSRVKPGMTVNAAIVTELKQDVIVVPAAAVRTLNGDSFVMAFDPAIADASPGQGVTSKTAPQMIQVETGISDDTSTEILSGLSEGQQIVIRTISSSSQTSSQSTAPSLFGGNRATGGTRSGGGGNAVFIRGG